MENLPPNLSPDAVRFDNDEIDQPNNKNWMNARIGFSNRTRATVGVSEFQIEGEVSMKIFTSSDKGSLEHEGIVQAQRFLFDNKDLETGTGVIRFDPTMIITVGLENNRFNTILTSLFIINEFT
jgi:hypothetical protein